MVAHATNASTQVASLDYSLKNQEKGKTGLPQDFRHSTIRENALDLGAKECDMRHGDRRCSQEGCHQ